jgi:hypothetical protein
MYKDIYLEANQSEEISMHNYSDRWQTNNIVEDTALPLLFPRATELETVLSNSSLLSDGVL